MAKPNQEDSDGVFLEDELAAAKDESDYSLSVVNLTVAADIPLRYFLPKIFSPMEASMTRSCQRVSEKSPKYRLLSTDWGNRVSSLKEGPGILALVTVESKTLDQQSVGKVEGHIRKLMKGTSCQLLRWDQQHILLYFEMPNDYETFGRLFLEEKLDNCEGFRVNAIEPSVLTNPPRCFVEIETLQGAATRDALRSFLAFFSGAFKHVNLLEIQRLFPTNPGRPCQGGGEVPRLALTLMFSGRAQSRAAECLRVLSGAGGEEEERPAWRPLALPPAVAESELGEDTAYFTHATLPLPLWGVKTGAPASGVRVTLFVGDGQLFQPMDAFYGRVTGVSPLRKTSSDDGGGGAVQTSTYPLSSRLEFALAHHRGLSPRPAGDNQLLYFQTSEQAIGAEKLSEDHWQLKDPEGNTVVLFTTMK